MEQVDKKILKQIKFSETELVSEPLDGIPTPMESRKTIIFGNTGFDIHFGPLGSTFDFLPEGRYYPDSESSGKYTAALSVALIEVYDFLNNPQKVSEYLLDSVDKSRMHAITNKKLRQAFVTLFSKSKTPNLVANVEDDEIIVVNLDGFKELTEDDPLIVFLRRIKERSKSTIMTFHKHKGP